MHKLLYGIYVVTLISLFIMAGWTTSIANSVYHSDDSKSEMFQDSQVSYVSGSVYMRALTVLYESTPAYAKFNTSINLTSKTPINVTIKEIIIYESSSKGEAPYNITAIGSDQVSIDIVNTSYAFIDGYIRIVPVLMQKDVFLGLYIEYRVYSGNYTDYGEWGNLFMLPVTVVPSILHPMGWIYANGVMLVIGLILLIRYFKRRM